MLGKTLVLFVFIAVSTYLIGCAAILNDNPEKVTITSDSDADIYLNNSKVGTGSATVDLPVTKSHVLKARKAGNENTIYLTNKVGLGWVVLDICCGLVPFVVDLFTGAWCEFEGDGNYHIPIGK